MNNWFEKIFTLNEFKISIVTICFFIVILLSIYIYLIKGDIPISLLDLDKTFLEIICGVNSLSILSTVINFIIENKNKNY